jgi:hypothetical protein
MEFARFVDIVAEMASAVRAEDPEQEEALLTLTMANGRRQVVRAYPFEEEGRPYIRFYTPVGRPENAPGQVLKTAMELNASLTHGAFALFEGRIVLADTMELEGGNPEEGSRILQYLGRMADTFEKMVYGVDRT